MTHGGKREGAGRPKGSTVINSELRQAAQEHTQAALDVIVDAMASRHVSVRLKAAEMILARGHGAPRETPPSLDIINRFAAGEISAISACLMLESEGLKVPEVMRVYFNNEMKAANFSPFSEMPESLDEAPKALPRS